MLNSLPIINGNFFFTFYYKKKNGGIQTHLGNFLKIIGAVAIQSVFCLEIYQNYIFFIFKKIIFKINISKQFKKIIFNKTKIKI